MILNVYTETVGHGDWMSDLFVVGADRPCWNGCGIDSHWRFFEIAYQRRLFHALSVKTRGRGFI